MSTTGKVKWFDATKGFGFVVSDEGGADILLHSNVLKDYGQSSIAEGTELIIEVVNSPKGRQASKIVSITPPLVDAAQALERSKAFFSEVSEEDYKVPLEPVRVKWFDKSRGFGCLNRFGEVEDIFVHIEILRAFGLSELETGEAVCAKVTEGDRGKMAIEVRSWDHASRP